MCDEGKCDAYMHHFPHKIEIHEDLHINRRNETPVNMQIFYLPTLKAQIFK